MPHASPDLDGLDARLARYASTHHGVFTRFIAMELGFSHGQIQRRLAQGRWLRLEAGVYLLHGAPVTWHTKVLACCLHTGGFASHRSAAVLHGLSEFRPSIIEISVERGSRIESRWARVHQCTDLDLATIRTIEQIPTTDLARLAVDLGAVVSFPRFERAIDELVGQRRLTWDTALDTLHAHARRGRNGVGALRALLLERYGSAASESALERAFERLLRASGLPMPDAQVEVFTKHGVFIMRVDFAYADRKIAIELDSRRWHTDDERFQADRLKRNRLRLDGWLVLEFTWQMVIDKPGYVIAQIREALRN